MGVWIKSPVHPGLAPALGVFGQSKSKTRLSTCNLWQGFPSEESEEGSEDWENCCSCLPLAFECKLKKGIVGALPFRAYRARPAVDRPTPI